MDTPYDPDLFDLMTPEVVAGDADWYERLAREAQGPVLELGAGTGRITLRLALAGIRVCALERDPNMAERLRQKLWTLPDPARELVELVVGDMQELPVRDTFSLIVCPLRTFSHLLEREERAATLARIFTLLQPGGVFAFDVANPVALSDDSGAWRFIGERELDNGERILRSEAVRVDSAGARMHTRSRFEHCDRRGTLLFTYLRALTLSCLSASDLEAELRDAGFGRVDVFADFDERPASASAELLVLRAVR